MAAESKALSVLAQLRAAAKTYPSKWVVDGKELPVTLRILSGGEVQECHAAAHARFRELKLPVDQFFLSTFEEELSVQILYRCVRSAADPSRPFAESDNDIRYNTTVDERNEMIDTYDGLRTAKAPTPAEIGPEMCAAIDAAIKKKDAARLSSFGCSSLVSFLLTGASPQST